MNQTIINKILSESLEFDKDYYTYKGDEIKLIYDINNREESRIAENLKNGIDRLRILYYEFNPTKVTISINGDFCIVINSGIKIGDNEIKLKYIKSLYVDKFDTRIIYDLRLIHNKLSRIKDEIFQMNAIADPMYYDLLFI